MSRVTKEMTELIQTIIEAIGFTVGLILLTGIVAIIIAFIYAVITGDRIL